MVAHRHMHEYGTTSRQLAEISVATRYHATRNPEAVKAMEDLEFLDIRETTVDVMWYPRMIAGPAALTGVLHDFDGAVAVIASADVARNCRGHRSGSLQRRGDSISHKWAGISPRVLL